MAAQPEVPTPWIGIEELPLHFANAVAVVAAPNAIFMTLGSVTPLSTGEDGQIYAPVRPITRVALAPAALPELIQALNNALEQHNELGRGTQ
jgi:hypothetical protein